MGRVDIHAEGQVLSTPFAAEILHHGCQLVHGVVERGADLPEVMDVVCPCQEKVVFDQESLVVGEVDACGAILLA